VDLKEIGNELAWMTIKWFLEDPMRISFLAFIAISLFMFAIAYPLACIADEKLEAEEERRTEDSQSNKVLKRKVYESNRDKNKDAR